MATPTGDGGASVTEGLATVYFPSEKGVFYNPPQIPNRDLSVLVLRHFAQTWQREQKKSSRSSASDPQRRPQSAQTSVIMLPLLPRSTGW